MSAIAAPAAASEMPIVPCPTAKAATSQAVDDEWLSAYSERYLSAFGYTPLLARDGDASVTHCPMLLTAPR